MCFFFSHRWILWSHVILFSSFSIWISFFFHSFSHLFMSKYFEFFSPPFASILIRFLFLFINPHLDACVFFLLLSSTLPLKLIYQFILFSCPVIQMNSSAVAAAVFFCVFCVDAISFIILRNSRKCKTFAFDIIVIFDWIEPFLILHTGNSVPFS